MSDMYMQIDKLVAVDTVRKPTVEPVVAMIEARDGWCGVALDFFHVNGRRSATTRLLKNEVKRECEVEEVWFW